MHLPSYSRRQSQTSTCWWVAAEGRTERPSTPPSVRTPVPGRLPAPQTPDGRPTAPASWTTCQPPSWDTQRPCTLKHTSVKRWYTVYSLSLHTCLYVWTFVPAWELHQHEHCNGDEEVKQGQFVHLLTHTGLPALQECKEVTSCGQAQSTDVYQALGQNNEVP